MWTDVRADIERARQALQLPAHAFRSLPRSTNWQVLEDTLYHTFCYLQSPTGRPVWLWEAFRPGAYGLYQDTASLATLVALVNAEETVWLIVNDSANKFWFYQGKPAAIHAVLNECCHVDEIYLLSKKYQWLLCLNHHDILYGVGPEMTEKLTQYDARPVLYRAHTVAATPAASAQNEEN